MLVHRFLFVFNAFVSIWYFDLFLGLDCGSMGACLTQVCANRACRHQTKVMNTQTCGRVLNLMHLRKREAFQFAPFASRIVSENQAASRKNFNFSVQLILQGSAAPIVLQPLCCLFVSMMSKFPKNSLIVKRT